ncbi:hypothetical protein AWB90_05320 [Mycobacterium paraense]|uniref:Uncharacterized protein n=1 Tax=Mycobacterium paraense TaxID=767916 RepID=A0A1X2AIY3_9MYCO|nr:hypothetical protein [Mycobacterium paraense]ORW51344.1 hypothetical protein AWB90_05320 [Mycobacterium paraense]
MTTEAPLITPNLVRQIGRDLLHAAAGFGGKDGIDVWQTAGAVTQIAPEAPQWQVIAVAAALVRILAGRTSFEDATDDEVQAAQFLREARSSVGCGQFERTITFEQARVMTAILGMAEVATPGGDNSSVVDAAVAWEQRFTILDCWQVTYLAVQLIRTIADFSGDPLRLLSVLIDELRHQKDEDQ